MIKKMIIITMKIINRYLKITISIIIITIITIIIIIIIIFQMILKKNLYIKKEKGHEEII
jgi:hypothetical protein